MSFSDLLEVEFIRHCFDNELEKVKACLTLEVNVNTVSEDGDVKWSGLTIAAKEDNVELLNILLSHPDIEINKTLSDEDGEWSALMFASSFGNPAIVSRLVQEELININYQAKSGETAVLLAIEAGQKEVVKILLKTGKVDLDKRDIQGHTLLFRAMQSGHSDVVEIIVKQIQQKAHAQQKVLIKSITEKEAVIKELEEEVQCVVCLKPGESPLYCCQDQHLVCSTCRPRVRGRCPSCRVKYLGGDLLSHRAAERNAERLRRLRTELTQLKTDLDNNLPSPQD